MTEETLRDLGAGDIPVIYIFNKAERCMEAEQLPVIRGDRIYMSAKTGSGIPELVEMIQKRTAGRSASDAGKVRRDGDQKGERQGAAVDEENVSGFVSKI